MTLLPHGVEIGWEGGPSHDGLLLIRQRLGDLPVGEVDVPIEYAQAFIDALQAALDREAPRGSFGPLDTNVYCEDCDNEHWLPNDDHNGDEDSYPWTPCPVCNPIGVIACPFRFEEAAD